MDPFRLRRAQPSDMQPAFVLFRRGLFAYLHRVGLVDAETAADPPIDQSWRRQQAWISHLWTSAAENWLAEDGDGQLLAWAMSVMRDGHQELTHFFTLPQATGRGLGRALLARAMPAGARHRSIVATQDPAAMSLYLRSGLRFLTSSVDLMVTAAPLPPQTDLRFAHVTDDPEQLQTLVALDAALLGFRRPADLSFLLTTRPAWIAARGGRPAGYVFGVQPWPKGADDVPPYAGPVAALDPADLPALLDHLRAASPAGLTYSLSLPLVNHTALQHLLSQGGQIDPFYVAVLSDDPAMKLDRYVLTAPSFIL